MKSRWNSVSQEASPAAETSDPPASAFLERRPLKQEGSLSHPVNGYQVTRGGRRVGTLNELAHVHRNAVSPRHSLYRCVPETFFPETFFQCFGVRSRFLSY
jgi:hypothetical protein